MLDGESFTCGSARRELIAYLDYWLPWRLRRSCARAPFGWLTITAETMKKSKATASRDFAIARRIHVQFARMFGRGLDPKKDQIKWSWDWSHYGFRTYESVRAGVEVIGYVVDVTPGGFRLPALRLQASSQFFGCHALLILKRIYYSKYQIRSAAVCNLTKPNIS